jgi:hypothetical protein
MENKEKQDTSSLLQGAYIVQFIKSLALKLYGHIERIQNQRMPKQITTATRE